MARYGHPGTPGTLAGTGVPLYMTRPPAAHLMNLAVLTRYPACGPRLYLNIPVCTWRANHFKELCTGIIPPWKTVPMHAFYAQFSQNKASREAFASLSE